MVVISGLLKVCNCVYSCGCVLFKVVVRFFFVILLRLVLVVKKCVLLVII